MTTELAPERPVSALDGLNLDGLSAMGQAQVTTRLLSKDFPEWSDAVSRVGHCAHPVRLRGSSMSVDSSTGEVLSSFSSASEPEGFTRIKCGNRRASACPACSREYAADTWHLISAGAAGGKGVPETVVEHPMVFATLTAPSFGLVHVAPKPGKGSTVCRGRRIKAPCEHGLPQWCSARHEPGSHPVGTPMCPDCYDYASQVIWQWHAPELWRRFTIALRRCVARTLNVSPTKLNDTATVQFAKVAEFQLRGAVHFHALIRLDGPKTDTGFAAPPDAIEASTLAELIQTAARMSEVTAPGVDDNDSVRVLHFGGQLDAQPVGTDDASDDELQPAQVAGYIAKYATKSAQDSDFGDQDNLHIRRLRDVVSGLAERALISDLDAIACGDEPGPYALMAKWVHMLGFRGHFSSKSRRYSTTLGALRGARRKWQTAVSRAKRTGNGQVLHITDLDLLDDVNDETTLVLSHWEFVGMGWQNEGETALAIAAATRAQEYQRQRVASRRPQAA